MFQINAKCMKVKKQCVKKLLMIQANIESICHQSSHHLSGPIDLNSHMLWNTTSLSMFGLWKNLTHAPVFCTLIASMSTSPPNLSLSFIRWQQRHSDSTHPTTAPSSKWTQCSRHLPQPWVWHVLWLELLYFEIVWPHLKIAFNLIRFVALLWTSACQVKRN